MCFGCENVGHLKTKIFNQTEVNKLIEENKEMQNRMKKRLELLMERAKLAVSKCKNGTSENNEALMSRLERCENEIGSFKQVIKDIMHLSNKTQDEVQKAKDIAGTIQKGSFASKFIDDEDLELFAGTAIKGDLEHTRTIEKNKMLYNEDERISKSFL